MKIIALYPTKAKWSLYTNADTGIGLVGYDSHWGYRRDGLQQPPGLNQLLHGKIMMSGFSRGRSAANFNFYSEDGAFFDCGMQGAYNLFSGVASGQLKIDEERWPTATDDRTCPVFEGYWTFAKRGTQVFITPASKEIVQNYA